MNARDCVQFPVPSAEEAVKQLGAWRLELDAFLESLNRDEIELLLAFLKDHPKSAQISMDRRIFLAFRASSIETSLDDFMCPVKLKWPRIEPGLQYNRELSMHFIINDALASFKQLNAKWKVARKHLLSMLNEQCCHGIANALVRGKII